MYCSCCPVNSTSFRSTMIEYSTTLKNVKQPPAERRKLAMVGENYAAHSVKFFIMSNEIIAKSTGKKERTGGGTKTACKGTSKGVLMHRRHKLRALRNDNVYEYAATLTYAGAFSPDWHICKRDIDVLVQQMKRKCKICIGFIWVQEHQSIRGAPHFHLLVQTYERICTCGSQKWERLCSNGKIRWECQHQDDCSIFQFREVLKLIWANVVKSGYALSGGDMEAYEVHYERHKKEGVYLEPVKDREAYITYLCKDDYLSLSEGYGRAWGKRNVNGKLDFSPIEEIEVPYEKAVMFKRQVKKWLISQGKRKRAKSLYRQGNYSVPGDSAVFTKMLQGIDKSLTSDSLLTTPHNTPYTNINIPDTTETTAENDAILPLPPIKPISPWQRIQPNSLLWHFLMVVINFILVYSMLRQ